MVSYLWPNVMSMPSQEERKNTLYVWYGLRRIWLISRRMLLPLFLKLLGSNKHIGMLVWIECWRYFRNFTGPIITYHYPHSQVHHQPSVGSPPDGRWCFTPCTCQRLQGRAQREACSDLQKRQGACRNFRIPHSLWWRTQHRLRSHLRRWGLTKEVRAQIPISQGMCILLSCWEEESKYVFFFNLPSLVLLPRSTRPPVNCARNVRTVQRR